MSTKKQLRINYIERISIKYDAKNLKDCQRSKKLLKAFEKIRINYRKEINIKSDARN